MFGIAAEDNIGTAAGHIGRDCDSILSAGLCHDFCFAFMELGIQHAVADAFSHEAMAEHFGKFDGRSADQHGTPGGVYSRNLFDDGIPFFLFGAVNIVRVIDAFHGPIGGDGHDIQVVDFEEFFGFRHRGSGHPGKFAIQLEVILKRDGGQCLGFGLDFDAFFGLNSLVQAIGPLSSFHFSAGVFVNDDHFPFFDDVMHIAFVEVVGFECVVEEMRPFHVAGGVEAFDTCELFGAAHTFFCEVAGVFLFLHFEVDVFSELSCDGFGAGIFFEVIVSRTGDDERGSRFVDQDVVDFVDDGVIQRTLHLQVLRGFHVVAEVVETELIAGPVRNVTGVVKLAFPGIHIGLDRTHGEPEVEIDGPHPLHVAAGKIIVDGDDMHFAGDGIEERGQSRDEGFSFTGDHFGDHAVVKNVATDHLHFVVPHSEKAAP